MVSPLKIYVALGAHVSDYRRINKIFILGAVGPVTGQALHGQVLVPRVYDLFAYRVRRVLLPVMTRPAEIYDRRLFQQETVVRGMGHMAAGAVPLRNRRMFCLGPFLPFDGVSMTLAADTDKRRLQQAALSGRMGTMAAEASLSAHHRPVHPVLAVNIVQGIAVASPA